MDAAAAPVYSRTVSTPALSLQPHRHLLGTWPPSYLIWAALALGLLIAGISIELARSQPYLGVHMSVLSSDAPLQIVDHSNAGGSGKRVVAISARDQAPISLRGVDLSPEPDVAFPRYDAFNRFLEKQDQIARALRAQPQLHTSDGTLTLRPEHSRPLTSLRLSFWFQLLCGLASWLTVASIWAFRRGQPASTYFALCGFCAMLMTATAAIYSTRELALPGDLFRMLSTINHFSSLLCVASFTAMLWHYPQRLGRSDPGVWLLAGFVLIAVLDFAQRLPFDNTGVHGAIVVCYLLTCTLAAMQWRATRGDPLRRASLQWFLLSWFVASSMFVIFVSMPAMAGVNTGEAQAYAYGMLPVIAVGMTLGIARYRLFDLADWWFRGVLTVISGAALLLLDFLFVAALKVDHRLSLMLALAVAGWAYFPLRQWLAQTLFTSARRMSVQDVPELLRDVLTDNAAAVERLLPEALRKLYSPLQLEPLEVPATQVRIVDDGITLHVPGLAGHPGWSVRWADQGIRLFSRRDAETAIAILNVLGHVATYQTAVERGVQQERARVAQDLHDDIGARLLTLLHRSSGETATAVREVLASLRLSVYGLSAQPRPLSQAFASWRAEAAERCEAVGVKLHWHESAPLPQIKLGSLKELDLARILREALSNALRHGDASAIDIVVTPSPQQLTLSIANGGAQLPPRDWRPGLGLRGMRQRVRRLGGSLHLDTIDHRVRLRVEIPLN